MSDNTYDQAFNEHLHTRAMTKRLAKRAFDMLDLELVAFRESCQRAEVHFGLEKEDEINWCLVLGAPKSQTQATLYVTTHIANRTAEVSVRTAAAGENGLATTPLHAVDVATVQSWLVELVKAFGSVQRRL